MKQNFQPGQVETTPVPQNGGNIYFPSPQIQNHLYLREAQLRMETAARLAIIDREYNWRNYLLEKTELMQIRRNETIELNRRRRLLATARIFVNAARQISVEIIAQDGSKIGEKVLMDQKNLHGTLLFSLFREEKFFALQIQWDSPLGKVVIKEADLCPKVMVRKLARAGVAIHCSRERRTEIIETLFAFLLETATTQELPYTVGWNKMSSGNWYFESDSRKTFKEMCYGE